MLGLPRSTEFNKRLPKYKFYRNLDMTASVKKQFSDCIGTLYWRNKISSETVNIDDSGAIKEIDIIEIALNQNSISDKLLAVIDRAIGRHIVFVLSYNDMEQLVIGYKERSEKQEDKYVVDTYFNTKWIPKGELILEIKGLSLDNIYEGWLRDLIPTDTKNNEDIKDTIDKQKV